MRLPSFVLALSVSLYLYLLNIISNDFKGFFYAIGSMLALSFVALLFEKLPTFLFKVILSLFILLASISIFFKTNYHVVITDSILMSVFVNKIDLSKEMISISLIIWLIFTAFLPIALIFWIKIKKISLFKLFMIEALLLGGIFVWLKAIGFEFHKKGEIRDPKLAVAISYFSPVDTIVAMQKAYKNYKKLKQKFAHITKLTSLYHYKSNEDNLTVVFVIGESSRGDHFGINGYQRDTTPNLKTISNLISFKNVASCDTITIRSLPCMLSPMLKNNNSRVPKFGSFVDIFRKEGFFTSIYSLQGLNDIYNYMGYDKLLTKYAVLKKSRYTTQDISLLPFVKEAINDNNHSKKLIIVHTLGSHNRYIDRVIPKYRKFKPICKSSDPKKCSHQALINSYDNTIVAIDAFLSQLIDMLKNKKALLIYTSDHGESLGENGFYFHGTPLKIAPKEQQNVPLIFWFSKKYLTSKEGQKLFENLKNTQKSKKKISHDDLFYSIIGCSAITSSNGGINESLNLCANSNKQYITSIKR